VRRLSLPILVALALGALLLCAAASISLGGPNRNGAMIVHTNDAYTYGSGTVCATPLGDPGTCQAAVTRSDKGSGTVVWLLASFLPTASPAVTTIYFGIDYAGEGLDPGDAFKPCGPAGTQQLPDADWPYSGRGNTVAYPTAVTGDRLFPFYAFKIEGGAAGSWFGTAVNPIGGYAAFVDDGNPPQTDRCVNFGRVRWYEAGSNSCPAPSGCQITLTSPAGGESWQQGTLRNIAWNSSQCGGAVRIELLLNDAVCSTIAEETANDGGYGWIAQQCIGSTSGYKIRVTDLAAGNAGTSVSAFSIPTGGCQVNLSYPDGGEMLDEGTGLEILWGSSGCGSQVRIELISDGSSCLTIASGAPNNGTFPWVAEGCGAWVCRHKIRVTDLASGLGDESGEVFCIRSCAPQVVFPNGGEILTTGTTRTISWSSTNCGERVRIDLIRNGSPCETIAADTENDGSFPWSVAGCAGAQEGYRIRITDIDSGRSGESAADFCIGCGDILHVPQGLEFTVGQPYAEIPIHGENAEPIREFSVHLAFDPAVFECLGFSTTGTRAEGEVSLQQDCGAAEASAVVTYAVACPPRIEPGDGALIKLLVRVKPEAPLGPTAIDLADSPAGANRMTPCASPSFAPLLLDGLLEIVPERFRRGDVDANGTIDIVDPIHCLSYQYGGGPAPPCKDAGDFDDSGRYDLSDCIANLCRQFGSCPAPPPPAEECGPDPTAGDPLDCASFPPCGSGEIPGAAERPATGPRAGGVDISCSPSAIGDSVRVGMTVATGRRLAGFQLDLSYDSSLLRFARLVPPRDRPDFFSARRSRDGALHIGCVVDFEMSSLLDAGSHDLGAALFVLERPLPSVGARLLLSGIRLAAEDLEAIDLDPIEATLLSTDATPPDDPLIAFPNPIRPDQEIQVSLDRRADVRVEVYDVEGRLVRVLHDGALEKGRHRIRWDGGSGGSTGPGSGIYYLRALVDGRETRRSVTLVR